VKFSYAFIALGAVHALSAQSQTLPNAGNLRQQLEQNREPALPAPTLSAEPALPAPLTSLKGVVVTVTAFQFSGNTLLASEELQAAVAGFLHRPLDYTQLQAAAAAAADVYRQAGRVVRAYLPEQDIVSGVVTIRIVEAVLGAVKLEGEKPQRVSLARIQGILNAHQKVGEFLHADALDRALLLAGDLPGVAVSGTLRDGARPGETDLVLRIADDLPVRGNLSADNNGSRSTGSSRVNADLNFNSILGLGDQISGSVTSTEGSNYLRLGATFPVGYDGWRIGANTSVLNYRIVAPEFAALDAKGSSNSGGLEASYPLIRARQRNLYFNANADRKTYDNQSGGAVSSHYDSNAISLGLSGNLVDKLGGGASNNATVVVTLGQLDLGGSPNQAADAATTHTEGGFNKLRYNVSRQQVLDNNWQLYAALSGQWADTNLDSSEKFYLGGATGLRAYPANEVGGAIGQLISVELRRRLPNGVTLSGFYDFGQVTVNRNNDFTGAPAANKLQLRGAGLALDWQASSAVNLKASWSHRIGDNPNPTATGTDQDGTLVLDRFWLNANFAF